MRLQTLYLLLACVVMLGGCSRCRKDDPKPDFTHPKLFIICSGVSQTLYAAKKGCLETLGPCADPDSTRIITDTGGRYFYQNILTFAPNDTNWSYYHWRFDNGSIQNTRNPSFLTQETGLPDSISIKAWLTVYNKDNTDSASAEKTIWVYKRAHSPYLHKYQGIFSDGNVGTVSFTADLNYDEWNVQGMLEHFCPDIESHQFYQMLTPGWIIFSQISDRPPLDITGCSLSRSRGMYGYYHFVGDSVFSRIDTENQTVHRLTFKGKKI